MNKTLSVLILFLIFVSEPLRADSLYYAIMGDAGKWNDETQAVMKSIKRTGVKNLILPGDNLYGGLLNSYSSAWDPWLDEGFKFEAVAIGNHNGGYANEIEYFKMPGEFFSKKPHKDVLFIILNSDNVKNVKEQAEFLERELNASEEKFVFVVYHHPPFSVSRAHGWLEKKDFHEATRPILFKYKNKITSLILGHDHMASFLMFDELPAVLSGASKGFRNEVAVDNTQLGIKVKSLWHFNPNIYWVKLELNLETATAKADFIQAYTNKKECTVEWQTGKTPELQKNCSE